MVFQASDALVVSYFDVQGFNVCCLAVLQATRSACRDTSVRLCGGWNRNQLSHTYKVVSRCCEGEDPSYFEQATMLQFAQQRDVLQPAEAFFDPLSLLLTEVVTGMPRGARIDRTAARTGRVLRYVRGHVHVATFVDELHSIITLVAAPTVTRPLPFNCSSITSAASRSARPLAWSNSALTISPLRFSISRSPL